MKNFNYILAVIFIILWVVGFFTHLAGSYVHLLLVAAFILILLNIFNEDNSNRTEHTNY